MVFSCSGRYWSRKGDREGNRLCPLVFNNFNAFITTRPFQDDADLVLGVMALTRGAANIADRLFGWHPRSGAEDFWVIFTLLGVTMSQKSSVTRTASLVP